MKSDLFDNHLIKWSWKLESHWK